MKLVAEQRREMNFLNNEEKEKWIEEYVDRVTAGARKRVEDTQAAIGQEQEDPGTAENSGLTTTEPNKPRQKIMITIGDSLADHGSSDDGEDGDDQDDEESV